LLFSIIQLLFNVKGQIKFYVNLSDFFTMSNKELFPHLEIGQNQSTYRTSGSQLQKIQKTNIQNINAIKNRKISKNHRLEFIIARNQRKSQFFESYFFILHPIYNKRDILLFYPY